MHCLILHIQVELEFPFPITITFLGLITTTISSVVAVHVFLPVSDRKGMSMSYYCTHVMPCGFFMAIAFLTGKCMEVRGGYTHSICCISDLCLCLCQPEAGGFGQGKRKGNWPDLHQ